MALWTTDFLQWSTLQETICVGMFYLYHIEYKFIWTHEIVFVSLWIRCVDHFFSILQDPDWSLLLSDDAAHCPATTWKRRDYVQINILAYSNENP